MDDISRSQAIEVANKKLRERFDKGGYDMVVLSKDIHEYKAGWLFNPVTRKFAETHADGEGMLGGGGIFVKRNGDVIDVPGYIVSSRKVGEYIVGK